MKNIATLTLNPTIDVAYEVSRVFPTHKMRTHHEYHNPGGGGINVARVYVRLGGNARSFYMSGGATGVALDGLLKLHQLVHTRIPIKGDTRTATTVLELDTGKEFRFVPPGPDVTEAEWRDCLDKLAHVECDYIVASGSIPPGVPDDFYARINAITKPRGIRMVLDTSGPALEGGLSGNGVYMVKPSDGELSALVGRKLESAEDIADAAVQLVHEGRAELVACTMGHEGAVLAHAGGTIFIPALDIDAKSAVGAGDSFVATMVYALTSGWEPEEAFKYGIAGGSAAVLRPGTDLARPDDIERLYKQIVSGWRRTNGHG